MKVIAEYWANIELDIDEEKTQEEIEEMAWREFYDEAHRASIEQVKIESDEWTCNDCNESNVSEDHECEEDEEEGEE